MQNAGSAVDLLRGGLHLVGRRRGEHLSGARGVEHAEADEAAVQRLVAGTAATHERDGAVLLRGGAVDHAILMVNALIGMRGFDAAQRVRQNRLGGVDEFLH